MSDRPTVTATTDAVSGVDLNLPAIVPQQLPNVVSKVSITPQEEKEILDIKRSNPIQSTGAIMTYASASQKRLGRYLDQLLKDETVGSAGMAGDITVEISRGIDRMRLDKMRAEVDGKNFLANLPLIGKYFSAFHAFLIDRKKIVAEFDRIEQQGDREISRLVDATSRFDGLIVELEKLLRSHVLHLIAGVEILEQENAKYGQARDRMLALPTSDRDPAELAKLIDYRQRIIQFETRLVNLHIDYQDNVQAIPQIRNVSKAAEMQMQDVMESLTRDLNRLKKAVLSMVSLKDIKTSKQNTARRRDNSRKLAEYSAEATRDAYLEAKETQGKFDDELAHLTKLADIIKDTMERGREVDNKNAVARKEVNHKLMQIRDNFAKDVDDMQASML